MAPATAVRPLVFYGVVPRGVSTAEIGKALLKRFTLAELHGVQDFQGGRTEILFKTRAAVDKMLSDPNISVGEHKLRFSYRGSLEKVVRVLSYPMDASDDHLRCALSAYGRVSEVRRETMRAVAGLATGVRCVRLDMAQPVPNFLGVGRHVVQCEYDGVLRVCRRCNASGHMASECKAVQCSRCGMFDAHEEEVCERSCPRCGGDHPIAKCPRRSFAQALTSYRPVAPRQLNEAAAKWQLDAGKSGLDEQVWPSLSGEDKETESGTNGTPGSTTPDAAAAPAVQDVAPAEQGPVAPLPENEETPEAPPVEAESAPVVAKSPTPKRDWPSTLRQRARSRPGKESRALNPRSQPEKAASGDGVDLTARHSNLSSSDTEDSRSSDPPVSSSPASASSLSVIPCESCEQEQCACAALSEKDYESS